MRRIRRAWYGATETIRASALGRLQRVHHTVLKGEHLPAVGLVVVASQVQHPVDDGLDQILRVLGTDDDVAKLAWPGRRLILVDRERQDVRGLVLVAMVAVQLLDAPFVDELEREWAVRDARCCERRLGRAAEARVVC